MQPNKNNLEQSAKLWWDGLNLAEATALTEKYHSGRSWANMKRWEIHDMYKAENPSLIEGKEDTQKCYPKTKKQPLVLTDDEDDLFIQNIAKENEKLQYQVKLLREALEQCKVGLSGIMPERVDTGNPIQMTAYHAYHNAKIILDQTK